MTNLFPLTFLLLLWYESSSELVVDPTDNLNEWTTVFWSLFTQITEVEFSLSIDHSMHIFATQTPLRFDNASNRAAIFMPSR